MFTKCRSVFLRAAERSVWLQEPLSGGTTDAVAKYKGIKFQDPVQTKLMGQNMMAHNLAYKGYLVVNAACGGGLRTFCLEARAMGLGLKELQLQLLFLEGSLTGAFAMRKQRYSNDSIRVRISTR